MPRRVDLLVLLALPPALGCYSYRPLPLEEVRPELDVRLRVVPDLSAHISQLVGYQLTDVEGTVAQVQDDTLLLTVPGQTAVLGGTVQRFYQSVAMPLAQVLQARRRQVNPLKTAACIALGVAGGAAMVVAAFNVVNGNPGTEPPIINNRLVIPLGHVPLAR
jgi:hypothetical protein